MRLSIVSAVVFSCFIFLLSGCGGGGGGGGSQSGISVSTSSMQFNAEQSGSLPSSQTRNITWSNPNVAGVVVGVPPNETVPSWVDVSLTGNSSPLTLSVGINSTDLSPGTYTMTVRVVSGDINGNLINYLDIPVTYTVFPQTTVAPSDVSMSAVEGAAAPDASVTLSSTESPLQYNVSLTYNNGTNFLDASKNGNTVTLQPNTNALALAPGTYSATLLIQVTHTTSFTNSITVPVSYTVTPALAGPSVLDVSVTGATPVNNLNWNFSITSNRGTAIGNLTAAIDVNWATVAMAGDTSVSDNLTVSLTEADIAQLGVGQQTATVTVSSSDANVSSITIPLTLTIALPQVSTVAPYVGYENKSNTVLVTGSGFSGLNAQVMFNATDATSVDVISDTRLLVGHGALSAGDYTLNITNIGGLKSPTTGVLRVISVVAPAETSISSPGNKGEIVYDDERRVLYVANTDTGQLERYAYDTTTAKWVASVPLDFTDLRDLAMARDGSVLIALTGQNIYTVDPVTFKATSRATNPDTFTGRHFSYVETTNNGKAIVATGLNGSGYTYAHEFDIQTYDLTTLPMFYFATLGSSLDGQKVLFVQGSLSPPPGVYTYDASLDKTNVTGLSTVLYAGGKVAMDRHATRSLVNDKLYDSNFNLLGTLIYAQAAVFSPDGNTIYFYDSSIGTNGAVRVFDLTQPDGSGGFTELSNIPLNSSPGSSLSGPIRMTISQDGQTLFITGIANILVVPVP